MKKYKKGRDLGTTKEKNPWSSECFCHEDQQNHEYDSKAFDI